MMRIFVVILVLVLGLVSESTVQGQYRQGVVRSVFTPQRFRTPARSYGCSPQNRITVDQFQLRGCVPYPQDYGRVYGYDCVPQHSQYLVPSRPDTCSPYLSHGYGAVPEIHLPPSGASELIMERFMTDPMIGSVPMLDGSCRYPEMALISPSIPNESVWLSVGVNEPAFPSEMELERWLKSFLHDQTKHTNSVKILSFEYVDKLNNNPDMLSVKSECRLRGGVIEGKKRWEKLKVEITFIRTGLVARAGGSETVTPTDTEELPYTIHIQISVDGQYASRGVEPTRNGYDKDMEPAHTSDLKIFLNRMKRDLESFVRQDS